MKIMINIQIHNGSIHPVCYELVSKAKQICRQNKGKIAGILLCSQYDAILAAEIPHLSLDTLYIYEEKNFEIFRLDEQARTICTCINEYRPDIFLLGATIEGRSLAPVIAASYKTGVTADCTELSINSDGLLIQTRPAYGGRIMAEIITKKTRPQIATVRYGVFKAEHLTPKIPEIITKPTTKHNSAYQVDQIQRTTNNIELTKSPFIIAIGGAVQKKEDITQFQEFAIKLGAQLMCSRSLVERGWMDQSLQIGLSGNTIAPQLLITMGIYGSCQFLAGIQNTATLCAINTDTEAPIFDTADYCICADIYELIDSYSS